MRYFFILCLLLGSALALRAQVRFVANSDSKQIYLDGLVEVGFELHNAEGKNFTPPPFQNFQVVAGPNESRTFEMVNGAARSMVRISYVLRPMKPGVFTIGSARITVKNQTLKTEKFKVEVLAGATPALPDDPAQAGNLAMLRAEPSTIEGYPGQQLILDYKIYMREGYSRDRPLLLSGPDFKDFFHEQLNHYQAQREIVNGIPYEVTTLARIALFPQRSGQFDLAPMRIQLDVFEQKSGRFPFNRTLVDRLELESEPVKLNILPIPVDAPDSFFGGVGTYTIQTAVDRNSLTTDESVRFVIRVQGDGDIKRVDIGALPVSDSLEVYPPNILVEKLDDTNTGRMEGFRDVEFLLVPKYPGQYRIPFVFSYWDPQTRSFRTVEAAPVEISVAPGTGKPRQDLNPRDSVDLAGPQPVGRLYRKGNEIIRQPWYWALFLGPVPVWLVMGLVKRRREQKQAAAAKKAPVQAEDKLVQEMDQVRQRGQTRAFYELAHRYFLERFSRLWGIAEADLTKERVGRELEARGMEPAPVVKALQTCEWALFAGLERPDQVEAVWAAVLSVHRQPPASPE